MVEIQFMRTTEIRVQSAPWNAALEVLIQDRSTHAVAVNVEMKTLTAEEAATWRPPVMTLGFEAAQTLMDDLWQCGLRPSEGSGSAGALAATKSHLDDMRKIALTMLERVVPPNARSATGEKGSR